MEPTVTALVVATMDTKGEEALYIADCLEKEGIAACVMDTGIRGQSPVSVDIGRQAVAESAGQTLPEVQNIEQEGRALKIMTVGADRLTQALLEQGKIQGIIGLGGSMGTTLASGVMRSLPIGFPKVMISTMASRDTRAFVGTKDIMMLNSVCDLSHLNRLTRLILKNGAAALAGMLRQHGSGQAPALCPPVLLSTLGTTEVCAQMLRKNLEQQGQEVIMFHSNGSGGKAMEEMITAEKIAAVVDLSLHEITDHLFGGDYDAGPTRGSAALKRGVPTILIPGNIDFLVTGPVEKARKQFPNRPYHVHNAAITVVRTQRKEIEILAKTIAELCNTALGPVAVWVPMGGFSAFDCKDSPLHDPAAPELFIRIFRETLNEQAFLNLSPHHINDPEFTKSVLGAVIHQVKLPIPDGQNEFDYPDSKPNPV